MSTYLVNMAEDEGAVAMTFGRGRFLGDSTPVRGIKTVGHPVLSSTRMHHDITSPHQQTPDPATNITGIGRGLSAVRPRTSFSTHMHTDTSPIMQHKSSEDLSSPDLGNLITQLAHQIGESIANQIQKTAGNQSDKSAPTPSVNMAEGPPELNLTGVKLVMQADVKEPPHFRGDETDKYTVHEWEEVMDVYLKKRGIPPNEHSHEIISKLVGKAKDVVRVTLRSIPSLKPAEDPKLVFDILKQHFSEVTYSSMPLADFYNTLPLTAENPMDYWIRLNKAVDVADECLRRQGRNIENPAHEVTMMFVKHCPDPALANVLKCKTSEKWTSHEIQEHLIEHQREFKKKIQDKTCRPPHHRQFGAHAQVSTLEDATTDNVREHTSEQSMMGPSSTSPVENTCIQSLIGLLNRVLEQKTQSAINTGPSREQANPFQRRCKVCQAVDHSTTMHCRQENLCMNCFRPGHWRRECRQRRSGQNAPPHSNQSQPREGRDTAPLN